MTSSSIRNTGAICLALLFVPLLLSRCGREETLRYVREVEQRQPADFPRLDSPGRLLDTAFYAELNAALRDRLPYRGQIITMSKRVELLIPGNAGARDVLITDDGWYYLHASFGRRLGSRSDVQGSLDLVDAFMQEFREPPPIFRLIMVPDKHTVYPEHLDQEGRTEARVYAPSRDLVHEHFTDTGDPRVIDMRAVILAEKERGPELLYQRGDTHHTDRGAMLMARELIRSLDPLIWNEDEVIVLREDQRTGDLHRLAGLADHTEPYEVVTVIRPDIKVMGREWLDETDILLRPMRYWAESRGGALLPGRALIVHDSMIGPTLRPVFARFFEDVTYWYNELIEPGDVRAAMSEFDYVIVECTVRESTRILASVFGHAEAPGQGAAEKPRVEDGAGQAGELE